MESSSDDSDEELCDTSVLDDYCEGAFIHMQEENDTPEDDDLIKASIFGTADNVQKLVDSGVNINSTDDEGKTALMHAVKNGKEDIVKLLIKSGADVNISDNQGKTALVYSILHRRESILMLLIQCKADINAVDHTGNSPLIYALQYLKETLIVALISAGVDASIKDNYENSALIYAIKYGKEDTVRALINTGANVNDVDKKGNTPLMYLSVAASNILHLLLNGGANVNHTNNESKTALNYYIQCGYHEIPLQLINAGADVNIADHEGNTALMIASKYGREEIVSSLIDAGAHLNIVDKERNTALIYASKHGREQTALTLIKAGADVNMVNRQGYNALTTASRNGQEQTALSLINAADADVNIVDCEGRTALMIASRHFHEQTALTLINAGADVNMADREGKTALMIASEYGHDEIALSLINASADVNMVDREGKTALMIASEYGHDEIALSLINASADVNMVDHKGETALMIASARYGYKQTALSLIIAGADVNIVDCEGKTALMITSKYGHDEIALSLINAGADVNMADREGKTALMIASEYGHDEIALSLINAGADVNIVDHEGNTPLTFAVKSKEVAVSLIERDNALLNIRDIDGRTPLFYAIVESSSLSSYLVDRGADLLVRDNHNVSPLSFFICRCIETNRMNLEHIYRILTLFKEKGLTKEDFFQALINVLVCKLPSQYSGYIGYFTYLVESAVKVYGDFEETKWKHVLSNIWKCGLQGLIKVLSLLIDLGADPDTSDEDGNTAIHYVTAMTLFGESPEVVLNIFNKLQASGSSLIRKNYKGQTPLLFLLSEMTVNLPWKRLRGCISTIITGTIAICKRIMAESPNSTATTENGESVFHLIVKIFQQFLKNWRWKYHADLMLQILQLYAPPNVKRGVTVNKVDDNLHSPVHLWASLSVTPFKIYESTINGKLNFEQLLEAILNHLKKCGAVLNIRNINEQTPLHLCQTWSAVKLLVSSGANPGDVDSERRSPFLLAAQSQLFRLQAGCFYPDVTEDALTFWKTAAGMKLDLWAYDVKGNSVLSILIASEEFVLVKSLLKVACESGYIMSDETLVALLSDICKDKSTQTTWKELLVKEILNTISRPLDMDVPLRLCCMNITDSSYKDHSCDSVHWKIAKTLLLFGVKGSSCLDIAEGYPELQALLTQPLDMDEVPLAIPWTSHSHKYASKLAQVTRRQQCQTVDLYWYHTEPIGQGAFGHVFAGINAKDGMEVAVKRIENLRLERRQDEREIHTFASLTGCRNVVHYLAFCTYREFSFIVLELMEGNLNEYFGSPHFDNNNAITLCQDVLSGVHYLHEENIIHRDIKPSNILYKTHPKLCMKIADFDLSRRLDIDSSFTVMAPGVGSRGWIAPEVVKSTPYEHSMASDMFSCGLIMHYIFSPQKHPFSPAVCMGKSDLQINQETEKNISDGKMESFDDSIAPEACDCIKKVLDINEKERPTAKDVLQHPMFWSNKKKMNLLSAVGNQPEFEIPRVKVTVLSPVESELEGNVSTIVKYGTWNDPRYTHMPGIYSEMTKSVVKPAKKGKFYTIPPRRYDVTSAVDLVRFIRNSIAHVSDVSRPSPIRKEILDNAIFLEYFPNITIEVYNAVDKHGWSHTRDEIHHAIADE